MSKNLSQQVVLDRRGFVAATFATVAGLGLAGCSDTSTEADKGSAGSSKSSEDTEVSATLDAKAFDKLVNDGPKADDDAIAASTWATAVKDTGVFTIGGVQTSTLFSLLNEKDGQTRGFDAGIAQLLSNYILGENKVEITQVTSDTRESVLQNGQVDAVFATGAGGTVVRAPGTGSGDRSRHGVHRRGSPDGPRARLLRQIPRAAGGACREDRRLLRSPTGRRAALGAARRGDGLCDNGLMRGTMRAVMRAVPASGTRSGTV